MSAMKPINIFKRLLLTFGFTLLLASCGGNDALYGAQSIVDPNVPVAASLIISTDSTEVHSDNSDSATITVLALDSSNGAVQGAVVDFVTTAGVTTASSAVTDANGEAIIYFSAGADPTVQTAQITATSGSALPAAIPVDIIGSTISITPTRDNLVIGGTDTATLTMKAADSAGVGVYNTPVSVAIDATASTGSATLSSAGGNTNPQGEITVDLTGSSAGTVRVVATALNVSTFYDFVVESVAGSLLITSPTTGSTAAINTATTVTISVPAGVTDITAVATSGVWGGSGTTVRTWTGLSGAAQTISDTITSTEVVTAVIDVYDSNNTSVGDSIKLIFVDKTVDSNSSISLQASPTVIAPSTSTTESSSALEARVINLSGNPIANARVTFSVSNSTGSGEYVYPAATYTDAYGVATATLFAGTQSSTGNGLIVTASLDQSLTTVLVSDTASVNVGGTAGSISIGMSTTASSITNNTAYSLPLSVKVLDSNGSPVQGAVVNLSSWPDSYGLGTWDCDVIYRDPVLANEDLDRDLINDTFPTVEDVSGDGELTPAIADAGGVPSTITTDADGFATFNMTYFKASAGFVYNAITASTVVQGTEATATRRFWLPALETDIKNCKLGPSPFNNAWPNISASVGTTPLGVGSTTTITVTLLSQNGAPIQSVPLTASFVSQGTNGTVAPTVTGQVSLNNTENTDTSGVAVFDYVTGDVAGIDVIKITYTSGSVNIVDYVWIEAQ